MIDIISQAVGSGIAALGEYLWAHVLTCLIPAFFIAGAMTALLPKEIITKRLGSKVPIYKAYPLAVGAALFLAVCSCTILPLFAGIKKKGAGIGPAIAFLYTAPATNVLAVTLTGSVIGWDFAASRILLSVSFAILIGIIISRLFKEEEKKEEKELASDHVKVPKGHYKKLLMFFVTLFAILIVGAAGIRLDVKAGGMLALIAFLVLQLKLGFTKEEIHSWLNESKMFFKMIFPLLLVGVFAAGVLTALIPENFLGTYVGTNTLLPTLAAVLFGVFMYFPTLVEVPMAKMFLGLGMAKGPLLAYLLADPVISLPTILVVRRLMGGKRTLVYILLIILFTTISGLIYGSLIS